MEQVYLNELRQLRDEGDLYAALEQEIADLESVYQREGVEWERIKVSVTPEIEQIKKEREFFELRLWQFDQTVAYLDEFKTLSPDLTEALTQAHILFETASILRCDSVERELVVPQDGKVAYITVPANGNRLLLHFRESTCHHTLPGGCTVNGDPRLRPEPAGDGWYQALHYHVGSAADFVCWMRSKSENLLRKGSLEGLPVPVPGYDLWRWKLENYGTAVNRHETRDQQLDRQLEYLRDNGVNIISFAEMRYALEGRGFVYIEWPALPFPIPEEIPGDTGYVTEKQLSFASLDLEDMFVTTMREYNPSGETIVLFCDAARTFSNILQIRYNEECTHAHKALIN
jgi:hypothetical protein